MEDTENIVTVHTVESDTGRGTYKVQINADGTQVFCTCKSFEFSAFPKTCKHIERIKAEK